MSTEYLFEIAATHVIAGGRVTRAHRPATVLEMAKRLHAWQTAPEYCAGCHAARAVGIRQGIQLCATCRERTMLSRSAVTHASVTPMATRATQSGPSITGIAIVFGERSVDLGGFVETIRPEAVDRTFAERIDVRGLWSHDHNSVLGRLTAGTLTLQKTARGLAYEIRPPRWAVGHVETVGRGDVSGTSFGFHALLDDWRVEGRLVIRDVIDARILEVSPTCWPAYEGTSTTVGEADDRARQQRLADMRLRLAR